MNDADSRLPRREPGQLTESELLRAIEPDRLHGCLVLDARTSSAPPPDHLPDSAWVPLLDSDRLPAFMLPPKARHLVVLADSERASSIAQRLGDEGWSAWWCEGIDPTNLHPGPPSGALWGPDPLVIQVGPKLDPKQSILDVGAGSGRDLIYLAQLGHAAVAVDRLDDALDLAEQRARHHAVELERLCATVRTAADLPNRQFGSVLMFRFYEEGLLRSIDQVITPGGSLLFRFYSRSTPAGVGPRRDQFRTTATRVRELLGPGWEWMIGPETDDAWVFGHAVRCVT